MLSGFFLSIPVFFDTVFFLLIPLAKALRLRAGKAYVLYVMAICAGAVITHSLVAPTPGPLAMVEIMGLDLGVSILVGLAVGFLVAVFSWQVGQLLNARSDIPLRETPGAPLADLQAIVERRDEDLPSLGWSLMPVLLPVLLITVASFLSASRQYFPGVVRLLGGEASFEVIWAVCSFAGNKNVALLIGAVISLVLLARSRRLSMRALGPSVGPALESAGMILLITSAGGAFGAMLKHAGIGDALGVLAARHGLNLVLMAWLLAVVMKIAQGSGTVAMLTTSAMMAPLIQEPGVLACHPVYLFLAIGFGSIGLSWMNDSGFWLIGKMSGFTERETLKTWTTLLFAIALVGLVVTLLLSLLLPFAPRG